MCFRALAAGRCKIYSDLWVFVGHMRGIYGVFTRKYHKFGVFSTICARILDESGPKTGEIGAILTLSRTIVTSVNRRTVVRGVLS